MRSSMLRRLGLTVLSTCLFATACGGDDGMDPSGDTEGATESGAPSSMTEPDPTTPDPTAAESSTGDEPGSTGDEPGEESSTGAEDTTGASADCYAPSSRCFDTRFEPFACGGAAVCDALEVNDPSLNELDEGRFGFVNPEAATCILEGLRDATAGSYRVNVEPGQQYSRWTDIEVLSDGSVVVHASVQDDKCIDEIGSWEPLRDAADFQACLDSADEATMLDCIVSPGDAASCIEGPTDCP